jgi:hypothetical protein
MTTRRKGFEKNERDPLHRADFERERDRTDRLMTERLKAAAERIAAKEPSLQD